MKAYVFSLVTVLALLASDAVADGYDPVYDKGTFLSFLNGKTLTNRLYGLTLDVTPNGAIEGRAAGRDVTGNWTWQEGYFCREMLWGQREIPYNCQLVEIRNGAEMRFTVDRGAGDSASFRLR